LKNIESRTANHTGLIYLTFEYGTRMNLAYIEASEKLDQLTPNFPRDMPRPQVMRINTSDIPVIRLQAIPKAGISYLEVSALAEKILKKRLEQLEGVSLVDINGKQSGIIAVTPNQAALIALGLSESKIVETIKNANQELGGLSVKDGQYRYFVKLLNTTGAETIGRLPIRLKDGSVIALHTVASVRLEPTKQTGYHLFNGKEGLVITVQKQPDSRMNELVPKVEEAAALFKKDYPQAEFALTQDQTFLLDAGISNLEQDLVYAGILTVLLLFMFLGHWASPVLMSISIPVSLIITFIFFYLFGISFNIISLSGLALGIGMLIDNSIVVIDSIMRKQRSGMSRLESSVEGTNEVIVPVISQVLTTVAVYAPLVLLSGMAGALVLDQAIGLTISLGTSLLAAFILAPLLCKMLLKNRGEKWKEDTVFYKQTAKGYHKMIHHILSHKLVYFIITLLLMPMGFWLAACIPVSALPTIEKKESLVTIDWNAPVDAQENLRRVKELLETIQANCTVTEAEVGIKQFLLQHDNNSIQQVTLYFACPRERLKFSTDAQLKEWIKQRYPQAFVQIADAPNAFTQLFISAKPYFEARFKPVKSSADDKGHFSKMQDMLRSIPNQNYSLGQGMLREPSISVTMDYTKMALYRVERSAIEEVLRRQFGLYAISEIKRFGEAQTIRLKTDRETMAAKLESAVASPSGALYPLRQFISLGDEQQAKFITSDKTGEYKSIIFEDKKLDMPSLQKQLISASAAHGFMADFTGDYFESRQQLKQLQIVFLVVIFLMYFILALQYNDLIQPLVVMATIPLGITGGMFFLWLTGGTLDVMSAIGFIVVLGLIVDDPILKIEALNKLEKKYRALGLKHDEQLLERIIHEAGDLCLKPLLLVSLTTSIAMVPVLVVEGIGNDLQKPMAIVIIGGLTVGTFFTTWFIPLAYWYLIKWRSKKIKANPA